MLFETKFLNHSYKFDSFTQDKSIRPWNAADEYALNFFNENKTSDDSNILILNDNYGVLSVTLSKYKTVTFNDSFNAIKRIRKNLQLNNCNPPEFITSLSSPVDFNKFNFEFVIFKIPKSVDLLKYELNLIKKSLSAKTKIIAVGMVKHLSPNLRFVFEEELGSTLVHKVIKKALLFEIKFEQFDIDFKKINYTTYIQENSNLTICNYPGVFSSDRLDRGTRLLIKNLPHKQSGRILDLGCGSGVIALNAAVLNPVADIYCLDESFLAVESARATFNSNNLKAEFIIEDGVNNFKQKSLDYVVTNPPFHLQSTRNTEEAIRLFQPVYDALKKNGSLLLVCNKSLNYTSYLKKIFQEVNIIDDDGKFIIIKAIKL